MLFDASIAHNIRYGVTVAEVSDEDIVNAAKMANIHDFVQSLPQVSVFEYRIPIVAHRIHFYCAVDCCNQEYRNHPKWKGAFNLRISALQTVVEWQLH